MEQILEDAKAQSRSISRSVTVTMCLERKRRASALSQLSERSYLERQDVSKWFTEHLKKADVRHRGANQCRHTFVSQALSSYVPVEWVARQLGHTDATMVRKHYGRWMPRDTNSMAGIVSEMMDFRKV